MDTPPSVDRAKAEIERIIAILRSGDDPEDQLCADDLQRRMNAMDSWYATKEQLFQIGAMCHPKAMLGDRYAPGLTLNQWADELDRLELCCSVAFNELERSGP